VPARVRRIALTGGIATGKSHVRALMEKLGVPTIDSDTLARQAVAQGTPGLAEVVREFGASIVTPAGELDRSRLGTIIFADPQARRVLEAIIHPRVREATNAWFASLDPAVHAFAVADIPLLYEVDRDKDFDEVIVVAADAETQVRRVMERDDMSEVEARKRLRAQLPIDEKVRRANHVIRTTDSYADTERQVKRVVEALRASR
jgi:dephospho-CoA kinase